MCSVNDKGDDFDGDGERFMEAAPREMETKKCHKCGEEKPSEALHVLQRKFPYCGECLTRSVVHKFRCHFGKSRVCSTGSKVLIAHKGDGASAALLRLAAEYKTLKFDLQVVHVDEGAISNRTPEERTTSIEAIKKLVEPYSQSFHLVSISAFVGMENDIEGSRELDESVQRLFGSVKSATSKRELLKKIRRTLLLRCAKKLECSHIFLADCSADLAADTLINVSLGGGLHMASDVGFVDDRCDIKILRPMRDVTGEELHHYTKLHDIPYECNAEKKLFSSGVSLQARIERFVDELQTNFPATISTVLRTGDKLKPPDNSDSESRCVLCESVLDNQAAECSSIQATSFSKAISNATKDESKNCSSTVEGEGMCCSNSDDCCSSSKTNRISMEDIRRFTCYRCQLTCNDLVDLETLPRYVLSEVNARIQMTNMRDSIKDFLIE